MFRYDKRHDDEVNRTKARELPDEDLDAVTVLITAEQGSPVAPIDEETFAAIREGLEQARRDEFVPDEEIEALWRRNGLRESRVRGVRNE